MSKGKVLIVDDEMMIRFVLAEALREWGYKVIEAGDAASARAAFEQACPVVVLTDINLPDGSGLELLREFKRRSPQTAVIVMTGEVVVGNAISALRGSADDFIPKPINLVELRFVLDTCLAEQQSAAPAPAMERLRVLVVTDSEERLRMTKASFDAADAELTSAQLQPEWQQVCNESHDIVIIDLPPAQIEPILQALRTNSRNANVLVLVSAGRLAIEAGWAGLLPKYRAMACGLTEMATLIHRRAQSLRELHTSR